MTALFANRSGHKADAVDDVVALDVEGLSVRTLDGHKSVYHAIYMNELHVDYIYPNYDPEVELNGEIDPEKIRKKLEENYKSDCENKIKAVMIVSPTYDGVLSDIETIAKIVHEYGIPLIVDEAHGAHFGFHPYFPRNANEKGADIVIQSIHKTLPSLTQTALILSRVRLCVTQ